MSCDLHQMVASWFVNAFMVFCLPTRRVAHWIPPGFLLHAKTRGEDTTAVFHRGVVKRDDGVAYPCGVGKGGSWEFRWRKDCGIATTAQGGRFNRTAAHWIGRST